MTLTRAFTGFICFGAIYTLGVPTASAGLFYKCVSSTGAVTYSGTPCSTNTTEPIKIIEVSTTTPTTSTTTTATTSTTSTTSSTSTTALMTDKVFSTSSFWYKPIPLAAPLDPNSANLVKDFIRQKVKYYNLVSINTYSYSSPVFYANSSQATTKVSFYNCQNKSWIDPKFLAMVSAVPIPGNAMQSSGTDGEMTVYQPSTNTVWEMWKAKKDSYGKWSACWGGKLPSATTSLGYFEKYYGTTATGLPFLGGQVTAEELARGEIKHAIGISLVELAHWNVISWPASRSDGYNPTNMANRIAEGQRFRLNPAIDVNSLPMTKAGKTIARAAQKYGFVVWDKAGAISIRAQNPVSYTALGKSDPYPSLFEYKARYAVLNGFPWDKLQFLPMHYGRS